MMPYVPPDWQAPGLASPYSKRENAETFIKCWYDRVGNTPSPKTVLRNLKAKL